MKYLEFSDPDATKGMEKKSPHEGLTIECPVCKGFGGWHLRLNAYGEGKHFDCSCSQCFGWGFVAPGLDATCIHDMKYHKQLGNCYRQEICTKCGKLQNIDSSD